MLALFKFIVGFLATSVAITADAVNNLSDAGTSVITFVSFKLSSKPADKDHPFGHARLEYISSMIVSFLIMHVGLDLLIDSGSIILGLKDAETVDVGIFTIVVLSVSILLKLWLGFFYNKIGKKMNKSENIMEQLGNFMCEDIKPDMKENQKQKEEKEEYEEMDD